MNLDNLKALLSVQGWHIDTNHQHKETGVSWYAWKRTELQARECEINKGKRLTLVIRPYSSFCDGRTWESAQIEVVGVYGSFPYELRAYSLPVKDLADNLDVLESKLVRAWNSLEPPT